MKIGSLTIRAAAMILTVATAVASADVVVNFDGNYPGNVFEGWKTEKDAWGNEVDPVMVTPGRGGAGNAQGLRVRNGSHYVLATLNGLTSGAVHTVSVWVRTSLADGPGVPGSSSWVEFGWDPRARDTTQPNGDPLLWNVDPKGDFTSNAADWVHYTGEPFKAAGNSVTIAFKVGSVDQANGILAQFDDLAITEVVAPKERYLFPDAFNTTYTAGVAWGWAKRFRPGGVTPHWAESPGRTGSAQRLYAGTEAEGLGVDIGVVKLFQVEPKNTYRLALWINAADSSGSVLIDVTPADLGPRVMFGVDSSGQDTDSSATTLLWNNDPTPHFSVEGNQNTWREFRSRAFRPSSDTVTVWLWAQGDHATGIDAKFDDLRLETLSTEARTWEAYP